MCNSSQSARAGAQVLAGDGCKVVPASACGASQASGRKQDAPPCHGERLGDLVVALVGAALFTSRPSKVPFIQNNIGLIEFAREKVAKFGASKSQCRNI
jgi:hypothetical protein